MNEIYWKTLAKDIDEKDWLSLIPLDSGGRKNFAGELFQQGIILVMVEKDLLAKKFLNRSANVYRLVDEKDMESRDLISLFMAEWLINSGVRSHREMLELMGGYLRRALQKNRLEIYRDMARYGYADIYQLYRNCDFPMEEETPPLKIEELQPSAPDKFPYETIGYQIIISAILNFCDKKINKTKDLTYNVLAMLELAKEKIFSMLKEENPQWDLQSAVYLQRQEELTGKIPFLVLQAQLLNRTADMMLKMKQAESLPHRDSFKEPDETARIEEFFHHLFSSPDAEDEEWNILDRLLWILIRLCWREQFFPHSPSPQPIIKILIKGF